MLADRKITAFQKTHKMLEQSPTPSSMTWQQLQDWWDSSPEELRVALSNIIDDLTSAVDNSSGADNIGMTPIAETGGANKVQTIIEALITRLKATDDGASGADLIGATAIPGVNGATAQAMLEGLKSYIDTTFTSKSEITNNRKLSDVGNFTGSWYGITNPVFADPGLAGVVNAHVAETTKIEPYHLYVGVNQKYKTITDAVNEWQNVATINKQYTIIHIAKGTYKETIYLTGTSNLAFIGENKHDVIWKSTTGYYNDAPLGIGGNVLIKGITFLADTSDNPGYVYAAYSGGNTGASYALHIDDSAGAVGTVRIEDCDLISYQNAALGSGTRINQKIELIRCNLYTYTTISGLFSNGAWLYHTSSTSGAVGQYIKADNCTFYSENGIALALQSKSTDVAVDFDCINSNFASGSSTNLVEFQNNSGVQQIIVTDNSSGNNDIQLNGITARHGIFGALTVNDCNSIRSGNFRCNGSSGGLNTPTASWYILQAITYDQLTFTVQYAWAILDGFKKYRRTYNNSTWSSWVPISENGDPIVTTDLNTAISGIYKCDGSGGSANTPTNSLYICQSLSYWGGSSLSLRVQYAWDCNDGFKKYKRSYYSSWTSWVLIAEP